MKKLIMRIMLVGCICWLSGCISTPPVKPTRIDLLQKQAAILECSDSYLNCLEDTKSINDFLLLDAAIDDCIESATTCGRENGKKY